MDLQQYKDNVYITGQISLDDIKNTLKECGFSVVVNNRVDGEEYGQLDSDEIKSVCIDNGIEYHYLPMSNRQDISHEAILKRNELLKIHSDKKILFFCRTGGRSEALLSHV